MPVERGPSTRNTTLQNPRSLCPSTRGEVKPAVNTTASLQSPSVHAHKLQGVRALKSVGPWGASRICQRGLADAKGWNLHQLLQALQPQKMHVAVSVQHAWYVHPTTHWYERLGWVAWPLIWVSFSRALMMTSRCWFPSEKQ